MDKKFIFRGHIIKPNATVIECLNCGANTRLMRTYTDENKNKYIRCGKCDEIDSIIQAEEEDKQ